MIKIKCSVHYPLVVGIFKYVPDRALTYMGDNTSSDDKFFMAKHLGVDSGDVNNVMWAKSHWKSSKRKTRTENGYLRVYYCTKLANILFYVESDTTDKVITDMWYEIQV
ncbi:hypothetical protein [Bacillus thuringiensis]|uniref:hypothetical protein n=1 Tax=Bacillus thuringiensis TaxID=1428 RepID=UPI0021D65C8B|nr:hypothetical protein [Bacillus thuringiensis]MCU7667716.1 hypothetical protein [Bacillus thuringiensis]